MIVNINEVILVRVADLHVSKRKEYRVDVHIRDPSNSKGGTKYSWNFITKAKAREWIDKRFGEFIYDLNVDQ
jgi:hypothetical protein